MVRHTSPSQDASHAKFEIPTSNNIRDMLRTRLFLKLGQVQGHGDPIMVRVQGQGHSDPKMVCDAPPSQDVFTHQIWNFYLIEYRRYAPDSMQFLETR